MFEMRPYRRNSMSTWNPFSEMEEMERRLFNNDFFSGRGLAEFKTDITDEGDYYELKADLPGFKKEDVKLDLDNGYLTISAQRNEELDDKDNEGRYIRQERATGSCARSFYVGKELEPKDISAKFENGILTLHLPKAEAKKLEPKQTLIEIE